MKLRRPPLLWLLSAGLSIPLLSAANCDGLFWQQQAPVFTNPKLATKTQQICYRDFAVMHSGLTRTGLWVAEMLTPAKLDQGKAVARKDQFHPDPNVSPADRAELKDYAKSGFDRGHLAPAADMSTIEAQYESFSLANMAPQLPKHNRITWESIESATRKLAYQRGQLYVVTGVLFQGQQLQQINRRVLVPTHFYKAIYDPKQQAGAAYLSPNQEQGEIQTISLAELEKLSGLNAFPSVSANVKAQRLNLPTPLSYDQRRGGRS